LCSARCSALAIFDWEKIGNSSLFGAAFIPVIFAYSGWNAVIYIAGEVKDPEENLPRALMYGVLLVTGLYLAINAVYIYAVPVTEMKGALRMSEVATTALFGYKTSALITAIITISILGALNVVTMIGPRIYYAMAKDGVFFHRLTYVHPAGALELSADSHQHVGHVVYLRERRDYTILRLHDRRSDRPALEAAGSQAPL
jgi:amino acid transporter